MEYNHAESVMKAAEDAWPEATISVVSRQAKDGGRRYSVLVAPMTDDVALKALAEAEEVDYDLEGDRARLHGRKT